MKVGIGDEIVGAVAQRQLNHKYGLRHTAETWDQIVREKAHEANALEAQRDALALAVRRIEKAATTDVNNLAPSMFYGNIQSIITAALSVLPREEAGPLADRGDA